MIVNSHERPIKNVVGLVSSVKLKELDQNLALPDVPLNSALLTHVVVRPSVTPFFLRLFFALIFFWNCTWWHRKFRYWIFKENSYYTQIGINGAVFGLKSRLFNFSLNLFISFSEIIPDDRNGKCVKVTTLDFQGNFVLHPKWGKCVIFRPKIDIHELFFKSVHVH